MPSNFTASGRFVLQATGENNNTWGVILNQGAFGLIDDNINGRLSISLSGTKTLTTANGAPDEARMAYLDVNAGSGGVIVVPAVSKGYFVRNESAGDVIVSAGGSLTATFHPGDVGPVFSDGFAVIGLQLNHLPLRQFIEAADAAIYNYINTAITSGSLDLPPAAGNLGKALIVRMSGSVEAWIPAFIQQADVAGLPAALNTLSTNVATGAAFDAAYAKNDVLARAFYGDLF